MLNILCPFCFYIIVFVSWLLALTYAGKADYITFSGTVQLSMIIMISQFSHNWIYGLKQGIVLYSGKIFKDVLKNVWPLEF